MCVTCSDPYVLLDMKTDLIQFKAIKSLSMLSESTAFRMHEFGNDLCSEHIIQRANLRIVTKEGG